MMLQASARSPGSSEFNEETPQGRRLQEGGIAPSLRAGKYRENYSDEMVWGKDDHHLKKRMVQTAIKMRNFVHQLG